MNKKRTQTAWLGGSILDRSTRSPEAHNLNTIITLPPNYPQDTTPVKDTSAAPKNIAPASFAVPVIQVNNNESRLSRHDENDNEKSAKTHSLLVPDRLSMEYKEDEEDDSSRPLLKSPTGGLSVTLPSIAFSREYSSAVTILLSKKRTSLGRFLHSSSYFSFRVFFGFWWAEISLSDKVTSNLIRFTFCFPNADHVTF